MDAIGVAALSLVPVFIYPLHFMLICDEKYHMFRRRECCNCRPDHLPGWPCSTCLLFFFLIFINLHVLVLSKGWVQMPCITLFEHFGYTVRRVEFKYKRWDRRSAKVGRNGYIFLIIPQSPNKLFFLPKNPHCIPQVKGGSGLSQLRVCLVWGQTLAGHI